MADLRAPRISGAPLKNLARFARTRVGGIALQRVLRADLKIDLLASIPDALREEIPLDTRPIAGRPPREHANEGLPVPAAGWAPNTTTLTDAYRAGKTTPRAVVERALAEARRLASLTPTVGPICEYADALALAEADESTKRWKEGRALGSLDGVPWAVKEETSVKGLPSRLGTAFMDAKPKGEDSTKVARVRQKGAICIGMTPMTEFGMTPSGANPKRAMPRNPHATDRFSGGSSTGSGVAVATGLVPFALGCDGGGSIRIPAALVGVFGIKPTWGRISRAGGLSGGSVAHFGPLAGSTLDLARALEAMSGIDGADPQTFAAPARNAGTFEAAVTRGVKGLVIGVPDSEWADASEPVQRAGRAALVALEKEGAKLVPLSLELAKFAPQIGMVVIACEARAGLRTEWHNHADEMGDDLQVAFASLDAFNAVEYLETLRLRAGLRKEMANVYREVDLVALPSTIGVAAKVSDLDMASGFLDTKIISGLTRFCFLGNLTGHPALSAPVGCDALGLPVGLQLMGDAWDEATTIAASAHLERIGVATARRPRITASILP
jgi:Asp-tRNA(Asn)/Glu-tRNA(Gln) amidotransferase A subunit family amidase